MAAKTAGTAAQDDPAEMDELVARVQSVLGDSFALGQVRTALRKQQFDAERATALLLDGGVADEEANAAAAPVSLVLESTKAKEEPAKDKRLAVVTEAELGDLPEAPESPSLADATASPSGKPRTVPKQDSSRNKAAASALAEARGADAGKEGINLVIIGHVDAGKSTLMGHLLFKLGRIDPRAMHKLEKESKQVGKGSFSFAWVLDSHSEERSRGITMDVAVNYFETEHKRVTLLDAPGHRDFIPNMISGAAQGDAAILVVDSTPNEFERGFVADGQTKEHAILVRSLGVSQLIVVVNKLENSNWSKERFDEIVTDLGHFLKLTGFKEDQVIFMPCSGLSGENLIEHNAAEGASWWDGKTLVEYIDGLVPTTRQTDAPFRMCVRDIFKTQSLGAVVTAGKIEAGEVCLGDKLMVMPVMEIATVKKLEVAGDPVPFARAGTNAELGLGGIDPVCLSLGSYLCDPKSPIPIVTEFEARVLVFDVKVPLIPGSQVLLYTQNVQVSAVISRLVATLDRASGNVTKKRPRALGSGKSGVVRIRIDRPVCLELYESYKQLGRFSLRMGTATVASGIISRLLKVKSVPGVTAVTETLLG